MEPLLARATVRSSAFFGGSLALVLCAWAFVETFGAGLHDPKLGTPWNHFVLAACGSAGIAVLCAAGYAVALETIRRRLDRTVRAAPAFLAGAVAAALVASGTWARMVTGIAALLELRTMRSGLGALAFGVALALFAVGGLAALFGSGSRAGGAAPHAPHG